MRFANLYLKYMTKLFDWIGSWYNEFWAWVFCIGTLAIAVIWVSVQ